MIDIGFKDKDDTITYLSDIDETLANTARIGGLDGGYKQKIIDKTLVDGSFALNEKRLESGNISIEFEYFNSDYATFLSIVNSLLLAAATAEYIVYDVNQINIKYLLLVKNNGDYSGF